MKLGLIIALSSDRKSGQVIDGPLPYDAALKQFKSAVAGGVGIAPELPNLEVWTGSGGRVKHHTFRKFAGSAPAAPAEQNQSSEDSSPQPTFRGRRGGK